MLRPHPISTLTATLFPYWPLFRSIGDRCGERSEDLRLCRHDVGARRRRAGIGIGPTVARCDEAEFGQPEIEHRACRLADIFAQLRRTRTMKGPLGTAFGGRENISRKGGGLGKRVSVRVDLGGRLLIKKKKKKKQTKR